MTRPKSSGSNCLLSAVDSTRSQNTMVRWRRSAFASASSVRTTASSDSTVAPSDARGTLAQPRPEQPGAVDRFRGAQPARIVNDKSEGLNGPGTTIGCMRYGILGAGGVGGLIGAPLARGGANVVLLL